MKYQKRPVVIEAFRLGVDLRPEWFSNRLATSAISVQPNKLIIHTLEGDMVADYGDWIIKGIKDELYPCKHEIFIESYSPYKE